MSETPSSGFDTTVGLQLLTVTPDEVVGRLEVGPHLHQPWGIVHGGVYCSVVETTASVGGATWLGDRGQVVGVSNHTNFFRATREGVLDVRATPVHRGRTSQLWKVSVTSQDGKLVAQGEVRLANVSAEQIGG